jgi:hypothetical protein
MNWHSLQSAVILFLAITATPVWAAAASSASFKMQANSLDSSGGQSTSSSFSVRACVGAAVVGTSSSSSFRLDAGCAAPLSAMVAVAPVVHGVCASPPPSLFAPDSASLCTAGTPGLVDSNSGWNWSCSGSNGGTTASCSSAFAGTATGTGVARATLLGTAGWTVDPAQTGFIGTAGQGVLPQGYQFPHGLFKLQLNNVTPGSSATVVLTFPTPLPAGTIYWKYGPTRSNPTAHWYPYPGATISGSTVTLSLTDGGDGDSDLLVNSVIIDPGGPGLPDASQTPIPTLSEWMLMVLALLMTVITFLRMRRMRHAVPSSLVKG